MTVAGRVILNNVDGKRPDALTLRKSQDSNITFVNFQLAANTPGKKDDTTWIRVSAFNGMAQRLASVGKDRTGLRHGSIVILTGTPALGSFEDRNGVTRWSIDLVVTDFSYAPINNSPAAAAALAAQQGQSATGSAPDVELPPVTDEYEDTPF